MIYIPDEWIWRFGSVYDNLKGYNPDIFIGRKSNFEDTVCTIESYDDKWFGKRNISLKTVPLISYVPQMVTLLKKYKSDPEVQELFKKIEYEQNIIKKLRDAVNEYRDAIANSSKNNCNSDSKQDKQQAFEKLKTLYTKLGWESYDS